MDMFFSKKQQRRTFGTHESISDETRFFLGVLERKTAEAKHNRGTHLVMGGRRRPDIMLT
jgi:hypothetical protein